MEYTSNIQKLLADNIRKARIAHHLTQQELAEKAGVITLSISNIERQEVWPRPDTLEAITKILELRPFELFLDPISDKVFSYNQVLKNNTHVLQILEREMTKSFDAAAQNTTDTTFRIEHTTE